MPEWATDIIKIAVGVMLALLAHLVAFLRLKWKLRQDRKIIDRIIAHLKLTFEAERPPPPHIAHQELPMAAEERGEYF